MTRASSLILPCLFGALLLVGCDPVKTASSDADPNATVDADTSAPDGSANPADCGNNQPDVGETCDDGNKNSGDGCSEVCLDESDFCDPKTVGSPYNIAGSTGRFVADGDYLYVTAGPTVQNPFFRVVDVSDPSSVGEASFFRHSPEDYPTSRVSTLLKRGNFVWLAGSDPGLTSINVTDPSDAKFGGLQLNPTTDGHMARIGENFALVSTSISERPQVFNITSAQPVSVGSLGDPGDVYYNVGSSNVHGFASTFSKAVDIYSGTADPNSASVVGRYEHATAWNSTNAVKEILSAGNLLILAVTGTAGGIHIVDVGIPSAPVWKSTISQAPSDIGVVGHYVYVPHADGLQVYDLSDAGSPTLAGSIIDFGFNGTHVAIDGSRAYLVGEGNLKILEGLPGICQPICGNNVQEYTEACDDGNHADGDGCASDCSASS